jgi:hypothetical protein
MARRVSGMNFMPVQRNITYQNKVLYSENLIHNATHNLETLARPMTLVSFIVYFPRQVLQNILTDSDLKTASIDLSFVISPEVKFRIQKILFVLQKSVLLISP